MKKSILAIVTVLLFSVTYTANAGQSLEGIKVSSTKEDSSMMNHKHGDSLMMINSKGDTTIMNQGDKMEMIQKCRCMSGKMNNIKNHIKNNDANMDSGTKNGSYGYFQSQRLKDKDGKK